MSRLHRKRIRLRVQYRIVNRMLDRIEWRRYPLYEPAADTVDTDRPEFAKAFMIPLHMLKAAP